MRHPVTELRRPSDNDRDSDGDDDDRSRDRMIEWKSSDSKVDASHRS